MFPKKKREALSTKMCQFVFFRRHDIYSAKTHLKVSSYVFMIDEAESAKQCLSEMPGNIGE